jgi:ketosteroid isomerase-like protein
MNRHSIYMCLALACAPAAFAADPAPGLTAAECEVFDRERSFADSVDRHDKKAFTEHVHENAVFGAASPNPQRGRAAVLEAWDGIIAGKNVKLEWRPQFVSIGADNVAISRGPFALTGKNEKGETKYAIGDFVSVWTRKDASSPWYVVLDGGGPPPTPATEEEVKRHMAAAPAVCPRTDRTKS